MSKIKTITVTNQNTNLTETIPAAISLIYYNDKNNLNITTDSTDIVGGKGGKINIESSSDILMKPGDDIILYSHHRASDKLDEVAVKVTDGDDVPVKLLLNASGITLTTKGKPTTATKDEEELNVNVNTGKTSGNTKGYLKVKARAIDLRCEEHGGIALQPKGKDSDGNMNKIKFEHGGGDGLEFGTFNTEKSSLFTNEYRFNKNGVVKMATRQTVASDKADSNDATTAYKYVKQSDDFYDVIDSGDDTTTWGKIIKTANAFNHDIIDGASTVKVVETELTNSNNVRIQTLEFTNGETTIKPSIILKPAGDIQFSSNVLAKKNMKLTSEVLDSDPIQCDWADVIKLVNWMKTNNMGPWTAA